jgi:secreted trypsin-like serine protease
MMPRRAAILAWGCAIVLHVPGAALAAPRATVLGNRVVGGVAAPEGKWPFQAYLQFQAADGQRFQCGATLVAPRWLLTAAHCAFGADGQLMKPALARLGSVTRDAGGVVGNPLRVVPHPQFSLSTLANDIALVELAAPVSLPIARLDSPASGARQRLASPFVTVLGWGRTDGGAPARVLQEAEMPLVDPETCNQSLMVDPGLRRHGPIDGRRLCAGLSEGGVDSCNGDSGGPLLHQSGGRWVQLGVVSYGTPRCGMPGAYGVYTRVGAFRDWIEGVMGSDARPQPAAPRPKPVSVAASLVVSRPAVSRPAASSPAVSRPAVASKVPPPPVIGAASAAPKLLASAAAGTTVKLSLSRQNLRVGDRFEIRVTSPVNGWLVLFDESNDGKVVQLFPNNRSRLAGQDGRVRAGATLRIPDDSYGFALVAGEPKGRGRITALVLQKPEQLGRTSPDAAFQPMADAAGWLGGFERKLASTGTARSGAKRDWHAASVSYVIR